MFAPKLGGMATEARHQRVAVDQKAAQEIRRRVSLITGIDRVQLAATLKATFAVDLPERALARRLADRRSRSQVDRRRADFANHRESLAEKADRPNVGAVVLECGDGAQRALRRERDHLTASGTGKDEHKISVDHRCPRDQDPETAACVRGIGQATSTRHIWRLVLGCTLTPHRKNRISSRSQPILTKLKEPAG